MKEAVREQVVVERSPSAARGHMARLEVWPSWAAHMRAARSGWAAGSAR